MSRERFAIDFDSYYTNIYKLGSGLVLNEPTVAAVSGEEKGEVKAIGAEAYKLIGKTAKDTKTVFPVFEGEIVNDKVASSILSGFMAKVKKKGRSASALFAMPCGVTFSMVEKFRKVARDSGIGKVYFAETPVLSAIGQRIPLTDSSPCFIIDVSGGTTNIAAVTLDGVIAGVSVNFGGNKISSNIIDYVEEKYEIQIGLLTADRLKREIGSLEEDDGLQTVVNGRDIKSGTPKSFSLKAEDLFEPIKEVYDKIAEISMGLLKKLPPEVSAEIRHAGIYVSGSGSTVYGLSKYYEKKFEMKVTVKEGGEYMTALGGGIVMGNNDLLKKIAISTK